MGSGPFKAADAIQRLRLLNQLPNSKNLHSYISMVLSTSETFKRVRWGVYKVADGSAGATPPKQGDPETALMKGVRNV